MAEALWRKVMRRREERDRMIAHQRETLDDAGKALEETSVKNAELQEKNAQLAELSTTDPLTKLPNRRAYDEKLERAFAKFSAHRHERAVDQRADDVSLIVCDIDYFKDINSRFSISGGDELLRSIGALLNQNAHGMARIGGEEFALVLDGVNMQKAIARAEALRKLVENYEFPVNGQKVKVTMSFGIAHTDKFGDGSTALHERAANAMRAAKEGGRNKVSIDGELPL